MMKTEKLNCDCVWNTTSWFYHVTYIAQNIFGPRYENLLKNLKFISMPSYKTCPSKN